ncbi:Caffeic acid 3-o-methyltransferase [Heracleum sosnowskyi]|uniref:Caffeic acid 3-o-methyltransferase n=1 Tax=Heracleum sosnowskyi TaxID=360622 RepID=A0AAD8IZJ2_9APIA|nr:Caffeic acid 3-o-methyltransferase [Heracleum sosnowskyi]
MASQNEEAFLKAMAIISAGTVQRVLTTLCELKVFDIIMQKVGLHGYLSLDEIASNASSMLDRMLCLLASHSIVKWKLEKSTTSNDLLTRTYGLTQISKYYGQDQSGHFVAPFHLFSYHKQIQISWHSLKDTILEGGIPFNKAHEGLNIFEYLEKNKGNERGGGCRWWTWCNFKLYSMYPHLKGINFDLPHVVQNAPALPGVTQIGGDIFKSVPGGEAILLQRILHDWNNEDSVKILKKLNVTKLYHIQERW